jgi:hypothetical protein
MLRPQPSQTLIWREAIVDSTTFRQLRSLIFDLHQLCASVHGARLLEIAVSVQQFFHRVAVNQRPCHVGGRREESGDAYLAQADCVRCAPDVHRRERKPWQLIPIRVAGLACRGGGRHVRGFDVLPKLTASPANRAWACRLCACGASARIVAKLEQTAADGVSLLKVGEHHPELL